MQYNSKIPLIIAFLSAVGLTVFGTTLTTKDYHNYNSSEHKILGVEVNPIVAFASWNASFITRQSTFANSMDEAVNRLIGLIFFMIIMVASGVPSYMATVLHCLHITKSSNSKIIFKHQFLYSV